MRPTVRAASAAVLDAAAADLAALAPLTDTSAGQHALLSALRALSYLPTQPISGPANPTTDANRQSR
jgi:hypothetical protein